MFSKVEDLAKADSDEAPLKVVSSPVDAHNSCNRVDGEKPLKNATVDGRNPANQLKLVVCPNIYKVSLHPRQCRISSINSMFTFLG